MIGHMGAHQIDKAKDGLVFFDTLALNMELCRVLESFACIALKAQRCLPERSHEGREREIKQRIGACKNILHRGNGLGKQAFEVLAIAIKEATMHACLVWT